MKKSLLRNFGIAISLLVSGILSANAAIITQGFGTATDGSNLVQISVDTNGADLLANGFYDLQLADLLSLTYMGAQAQAAPGFSDFFFIGSADSTNLYAGLDFFDFDANFMVGGALFAVQGVFDLLGGYAELTIYDENNQFVDFIDNLSIGTANVVSEPGSLAIFSLMLAGLALRRRQRA
ncbi:PEP-CTERM sorting domain-containing protein [Bowmanella denitrificans]|uniref:PEP-CTERM sorting domain-containing protein n=1 Tax=Bowmanella denitrificans TaxID=366582 RepID=UPI000C9B5918|nr:PEP-CTERM sorting domain-containing protein [Bowmanella denitrificans]